jgi:SIR2-like domain
VAKVAVLLGAGASADADLPMTVKMINCLLDDFRQQAESAAWPRNEPMRSFHRLLEFIVHGLRQEAVVRNEGTEVDVETMFEAIETLANRTRLSIAPFIASWHPLVSAAEAIVADSQHIWPRQHQLSKLLADAIHEGAGAGGSFSSETFEIRRFVEALLQTDDEAGSAFAGLAGAVLESVVRVLQLKKKESVRYLEPLVKLYREQTRLDIATLNYDLTIETLAELTAVDVDTGMDQWKVKRTIGFTGPFRLFKLHGSIDWQSSFGEESSAQNPYLPFEGVERTPGQIPRRPALIFGAGNKLRAEGPYLELLHRFEEALGECDSLLVVGYSFRDQHVNALLTNWLNTNTSKGVVVLDPSVGSFDEWGYVPVEKQTIRLHLARLAKLHPARVQLIPGKADGGLAAGIEAAKNRTLG